MKPVINEINNIIYNIFKRQNPILAEIIINWARIVGIKFSHKSTPLKICVSRERNMRINILYISIDNSSVSMEMAFQQEIIIERIAVYLGYKGIHKIKMLVNG